MMTLARARGPNHEAASIYDDYFHSKHYMTGMNDLFTEIFSHARMTLAAGHFGRDQARARAENGLSNCLALPAQFARSPTGRGCCRLWASNPARPPSS